MVRLLFVMLLIFSYQLCKSQTNSVDYLGQTPPGDTAIVFAPGIVTGYVHGKVAISPNGDEIFWVVNQSTERILTSKLVDGTWTTPAAADFVRDYLLVFNGDPVFSHDGNKLFFYSNRAGGIGSFDVWYVEKTENGWSDAVNIGEPYNTPDYDPTPIFSGNENAYRFDYNNNNLCYTYSNNDFTNPESVEVHPDYSPWWSIYISPEEDYLIFAGGSDNADLFIRFKNEDNQWSESINMGEKINTTEYWERFPVVSPDGKYLFFIRGNTSIGNLYWVSTEIIDSIKSTITILEEDKTGLNIEFRLNQNYPNPFNPSTRISYFLKEPAVVKLLVYNTLGQKIKTLVNSFQSANDYTVVWDSMDNNNIPVSSGIYFYSLSVDDKTLYKKMVLLR